MRVFRVLCVFAVIVSSGLGASEPAPIPPPRHGESQSARALAAAKTRGSRSAEADIRRGVLRILDFGAPLPPDTGRRTDRQTRYRLVSIWGCVVTERFTTEVDAYNDTMRAWHARHRR